MQTETEQLSSAFSKILREWLTPAEMEEINTLNELPENEGFCASHEYCDPNEAMVQAFKSVFNRDIKYMVTDTDRMNKAWGMSKAAKFLN